MQEQVCKNCSNHFTGKYCNNCGEKIYSDKDKKITHLLEEGLHFITHFEGTFFTTLKTILLRPGKLSEDYCQGIRKKYFKPLSFFLFLVVIYLLFPLLDGLNTKLFYHTQHEMYGAFAQQKAEAIMAAQKISFEALSENFHHKSMIVSKILLFTIIPFMAGISFLLAFNKRKFYYDHFVYSIEHTSFLLLWGFLIFPLIMLGAATLFSIQLTDNQWLIGIPILVGMIIFTKTSSRRFFKMNHLRSITYSFIYLVVLFLFLQYIYKFLLFYFTIIQI
ncbi:MAG: DUF3667 domain-containing protein [Ferruginibacter sp.]